MNRTPRIPTFHAGTPTRMNCFLEQWMDWRNEAYDDMYAGQGANGQTSKHAPAQTKALRAWALELIRHLPPTHPFDKQQLQADCMRFLSWTYMYPPADDALFSYTTLFVDAFPDLKDIEVNLRDAHFITWFIKNGFDQRLSIA